jgi:hypothetical protein
MFQKIGKCLFLIICLICLAGLSVFAQSAAEKEAGINKRPLKDFARLVSDKVTANKIDLTEEFSIEIESFLTKQGKLDAKRTKFQKTEGNENLVEIAKQAIQAVSDSGWLGYLQKLGVDKINVKLSQDKEIVKVIIACEQTSQEKARITSSAFNALLKLVVLSKKQNYQTISNTENMLLNGTKVTSEENRFIINFELPKSSVEMMIRDELGKIR